MSDCTEEISEPALEVLRNGKPADLVTVVEAHGPTPRDPRAKMLVYADDRTIGTLGGGPSEARVIKQARQPLTEGRSHLLEHRTQGDDENACGGAMRFFVHVLLPRPTFLIVGAGHIGQAVASIDAWLGYRIAALGERPSLVSDDRFRDAHVLHSDPWTRCCALSR